MYDNLLISWEIGKLYVIKPVFSILVYVSMQDRGNK